MNRPSYSVTAGGLDVTVEATVNYTGIKSYDVMIKRGDEFWLFPVTFRGSEFDQFVEFIRSFAKVLDEKVFTNYTSKNLCSFNSENILLGIQLSDNRMDITLTLTSHRGLILEQKMKTKDLMNFIIEVWQFLPKLEDSDAK
jgi:hypothetical protein